MVTRIVGSGWEEERRRKRKRVVDREGSKLLIGLVVEDVYYELCMICMYIYMCIYSMYMATKCKDWQVIFIAVPCILGLYLHLKTRTGV